MKTYYCKKINEDFLPDGNLNKIIWKDIDKDNFIGNASGSKPLQDTYFKSTWSENYLYFAFCCNDDYQFATMNDFNDRLYDEDVVEVFLDDDMDQRTYMEIEVNPLNALLHYHVLNNLNGKLFTYARVDKNIKTAVSYDEKELLWNVELAIPFSEFVTAKNTPPAAGDRWGLNLYRIDTNKKGEKEYTAWSPTLNGSYHIPERFGELVFID